MKVGVRLARRAAEGAEATADEADVGEVDVAVDDISDRVADAMAADVIGGEHQGFQLASARLRQSHAVVKIQFAPTERAVERFGDRALDLCEQRVEPARRLPLNFGERFLHNLILTVTAKRAKRARSIIRGTTQNSESSRAQTAAAADCRAVCKAASRS